MVSLLHADKQSTVLTSLLYTFYDRLLLVDMGLVKNTACEIRAREL